MEDYPEDLKYHKEHMWVRADGTIGITFFAQDQLGDIVFIEVPDEGTQLEGGEPFGEIESRKSVSDLFSPVTGSIKEVNQEVLEAPEIMNEDPYGKGWIAVVDMADAKELEDLLTPVEYRKLVEEE